jgi:hypothetical protein
VELEPDTPATLLDQRNAGKQLVLITNSDFQYTEKMMAYAFDRFLPGGMTWRDLFSMVIVQVRAPLMRAVAGLWLQNSSTSTGKERNRVSHNATEHLSLMIGFLIERGRMTELTVSAPLSNRKACLLLDCNSECCGDCDGGSI